MQILTLQKTTTIGKYPTVILQTQQKKVNMFVS